MIKECQHKRWIEEDYDDVDPMAFIKCLDCGAEFKAWESKKDMDDYPKGYSSDDIKYYIDDDWKKLIKI